MTEERAEYKLDDKTLAVLNEPFPDEALETDDSRGFQLVGLKGYYVIERLNRAFGLCGTGWKYDVLQTDVRENEVNVTIAFQYRIPNAPHLDGWSIPIWITGNNNIVKNRVGDALKGALTDGIKKAASLIGVGMAIYKGERRNGHGKQPAAKKSESAASFTYDGFKPDAALFERAGAVVFPSGKHEGECIKDVDEADRGYVAWQSENDKPSGDAWEKAWAACRYYRAYRHWQEAANAA